MRTRNGEVGPLVDVVMRTGYDPADVGKFLSINAAKEVVPTAAPAGSSYPPGHQLFVDPSRTDVYVPDGSIGKPFLTAQAAVDAAAVLAAYGGVAIFLVAGNCGSVVLENAGLFSLNFLGSGSLQDVTSAATNNQLYWLSLKCGIYGNVNLVASAAGFLASGCQIWGNYFPVTASISCDVAGGEVDFIECSGSPALFSLANGTYVVSGGNGFSVAPSTNTVFLVVDYAIVGAPMTVDAPSEYRIQRGSRVNGVSVALGGVLDVRGPAVIRGDASVQGTATIENCDITGSFTIDGTATVHNATVAGMCVVNGTLNTASVAFLDMFVANPGSVWTNYSDAYLAGDPTKWAVSSPLNIQAALDRIAAVVGNPVPIP